MVHLEEITVTNREDETEKKLHPADGEPPVPSTRKEVERREQNNLSGVDDSGSGSTPGYHSQQVLQHRTTLIPDHRQNRGDSKVDGNGNREKAERSAVGQEKDSPPTAEDYRAKFYEIYHQKAEHHDKEFINKYDEDLNTTLIFAGLFSAVASAFIIEVNSELKPDPNEETAALLRVLIHKVDNTTFGDDAPAVPQWAGPPHTIVHVQAILFASLTASLFSAFLAMLGKQWLDRYKSVDMRGSATERSQSRQRKVDGIAAWYFDQVMQSLPLMLQAALLLFGCALSRYLWEVNTTVASVVIGVTSFGVLFYLFIVVAGAASASCPYQTPGAHILRGILRTPAALRSAFFAAIRGSFICNKLRYLDCSLHDAPLVAMTPIFLLVWLILDAYQVASWLLNFFSSRVYLWSRRVSELPVAVLDLHCISWIFQTSLDRPVRLLTLNYLVMTTTADPDPTLVADCFNILTSCIKVIDGKAVVTQGMEQLAPASALCYLHILSLLTVADPMLRALGNVRQQYDRGFPDEIDFMALPFSQTLNSIDKILHPGSRRHRRSPQWEDYKPSSDEHVIFARALAKASHHQRLAYGIRGGGEKVPRWLLRFALHSLSQSPLPSTSVVVNCLSIIAIDLECGLANTVTSDESVSLDEVTLLIAQKLESMAEIPDPRLVKPARKAIGALFPYAVSLVQGGQQRMADAISHAASASRSDKFMWHRVGPFITGMFKRQNPPSLTWVLGLISTRVYWRDEPHDKSMVATRAAAASAASSPEGVCWSVVDELLHIAFTSGLQEEHEHLQRPDGTGKDITHQVRALGDTELLKSHLILALSDWCPIYDWSSRPANILTSIREDFSGVGVGCHREDLIKRLAELERACDIHFGRTMGRYEEFKRVLLEVDGEATNILTRSHLTFMCALPLSSP